MTSLHPWPAGTTSARSSLAFRRSRSRHRGGRRSASAESSSPGRARDRDGGELAIRVEREEKPLILDSNPEIYFETPHYASYPGVLVRLEAIGREELEERLEDAWLIQAPKRLAAEYLAART